MKKIIQISKLPLMLLFALLIVTGCGKDDGDDGNEPSFSFIDTWTINYNYTAGNIVSGSFSAKLKSNDMWDYTENSSTFEDVGPWSSSGNNVTFTFNNSGGAVYTGSKTGDNSLSGTMVADNGVSSGTWTATR